MTQLFANNAVTTLNGAITAGATSITVTDGSVFPSPSGGDYFLATIYAGSNKEIVKCTARSTNVLTVVRGQEGTTGFAFADLNAIELRATAALFSKTIVNDTTDNLSVGFTTDTEVLASDTITPDMTAVWLKTRAVAGNVTINFPTGGKNACRILFVIDGTDRTVTLGTNVTSINGIPTLTASTKWVADIVVYSATECSVEFAQLD